MRALNTAITGLCLTVSATAAMAYELKTHATMTAEASARSKARIESSLSIDLGIYTADRDLGFAYINLSPSGEVRFRHAKEFDLKHMLYSFPLAPNRQSMVEWMMRGAIREDDSGDIVGKVLGEPLDDTYGNFNHVCSHFFDPYFVRKLTGFCFFESVREMAVNWGIGTADAFPGIGSVVRDPNSRNYYSVFQARELMFRALTQRNRFGSVVEGERKTYWASTFRALGNVVHVLQDMAQPQHTRNEAHAPFLHSGEYEQYVEAKGNPNVAAFHIDAATLTRSSFALGPLDFSGRNALGQDYPIPRFNNYTDYFSTARGPAPREQSLTGKGLADYSSRGFLTVGSSLGRFSEYPSPPRNPGDASYMPVVEDTLCGTAAQELIKWGYLKRSVDDELSPAHDDIIRVQTRPLWRGSPQSQFYSTNHCIFDDMAKLLVPRAVAYSAGAIDYFFRGKLQIELPDEQVYAVEDFSTSQQAGAGFKKLKMKIKNVTPDVATQAGSFHEQTASPNGKLIAVLKYRRNTCLALPSLQGVPHEEDGVEVFFTEACRQPSFDANPLAEIVVSEMIDAPSTLSDFIDVVFTFPTPLPFNAIDVDLHVVYRGPLGDETDGIAVGFEHISEPNFFNFDNFSDCQRPQECFIGDGSNPQCLLSLSVKLPFWLASGPPSWRQVASVSNLLPGQYARVAFLTRTAFREEFADGSTFEVATNQDFPYDVIVTWTPSGDTETWFESNGPRITPLAMSRPLNDGTNLFGWDGFGFYNHVCGGQPCSGFKWAQSCPSIHPDPQPATINFLPP